MTHRSEKKPTQRQLRVAEEIRHTLAHVFERREVHHPDLMDAPVTITEVQMSADLRRAIVYFRPLGQEPNVETVSPAMDAIRGFLRRRIGETLRLKFVPDLDLRLDKSFDEAEKIERLLGDPKVRQDIDATAAASQQGGDV